MSDEPLQRAFQLFTRSNFDLTDQAFQPFRDGVDKAVLYHDPETGREVALLRYAPGASVPRHEHIGYEHIFVLEGEQRDEAGAHPAGSLMINPPGSCHSVMSPRGCVVLAIWERAVAFE